MEHTSSMVKQILGSICKTKSVQATQKRLKKRPLSLIGTGVVDALQTLDPRTTLARRDPEGADQELRDATFTQRVRRISLAGHWSEATGVNVRIAAEPTYLRKDAVAHGSEVFVVTLEFFFFSMSNVVMTLVFEAESRDEVYILIRGLKDVGVLSNGVYSRILPLVKDDGPFVFSGSCHNNLRSNLFVVCGSMVVALDYMVDSTGSGKGSKKNVEDKEVVNA